LVPVLLDAARGLGNAVGIQPRQRRAEAVALAARAERGVQSVGAERTALRADRALERSGSLMGDDIDDAADGLAAVKRALRSAQDFDARDIVREQIAEIEFVRGHGIADLDPVDQDER